MAQFEKSPLSSKKFIAYFLAELTWKGLIVATLLIFKSELTAATVWGWWFLVSIVIVAGFLEIGFIGGQAWLDRYVRVAKIMAKGPTGAKIDPPASDPAPDEKTDPESEEKTDPKFEVPPELEWDESEPPSPPNP